LQQYWTDAYFADSNIHVTIDLTVRWCRYFAGESYYGKHVGNRGVEWDTETEICEYNDGL